MFWITGNKGLLGTAVCKRVKALGYSCLQTGKELDIADLGAVRNFLKAHQNITYIINCAAFSEVDAAEGQREAAYRVNAIGPEHLAIGAEESGAKLIHISTDYVFAGKGKTPLTEKDPVGPSGYYGVTKLEGEIRALARSALVIRTSWLFGVGGRNLISKLLFLLQTQKEIRLTDDQWGRFTYAPDLADAIFQLLECSGLYQFANQGVATKYEFGVEMRSLALQAGLPIKTETILPVSGSSFPAPCERPIYSAFDTTKIESLLLIRSWKESLKEFVCAQQPVFL